ncbi:Predicted O-methyltransferase YrrM [Pseudomonas syringae]|uniref:class I SAM-dependent methyltransferase n=1 Tax=Pseudomonas syringae TaxID=317 RepID=UPI000895854A|nr:class I SAM-dependent methyltransferase [Pseudomonas syringae]SDX27290.1 Predicted O-methyltransferase YrrM [Pseudomonas syringae]SFM69515.1 Predicted O-methyltransferase YrrM [Pseudomonas syringae]
MNESKSLQDIYAHHQGFVSDKWTIYIPFYDHLFSHLRNKPINLLEIGVQNGGSLEIWSLYFKEAIHIIGCDINPACAQLAYAPDNISVVIGDINHTETLTSIFSISENFDVIIDDGSHLSSDIIKSFSNVFSHLNRGGLYVAEDLHCGYWAEYEGGLDNPTSCIGFFKALADVVNHEHWGLPVSRRERLSEFCLTEDLSEELLSEIYSVEFVNSICVVRRKKSHETQLGVRVVKGNKDPVVPVQHLNGSLSQAPKQQPYSPPATTIAPADVPSEKPVINESNHDKKDGFFESQAADIAIIEAEKLRLIEQLQVIEKRLTLAKETVLKK